MTQSLSHVRPELARPSPYRWQEGIPEGPVSRFDMNTLPLSPAWWPAVAADVAALPACSYPDATYAPLREAIGAFAGFPPEQVVPGAGADEIILLSGQLALGRGDLAVVARPTYQLYAVATRTAGARLEAVDPLPGPELRLDLDAVLARAPEARMVWLCSPNNPTGEEVPAAVVEAVCAACPGLVLVDQAYLELGGEDLSFLVGSCDNLIVARTFSKGWGLGAIRCGYALASPELAGALDALRPPGSISSASARTAELACAHADEMRADATAYRAERERLAAALRALDLELIGGAGNYVTVRTPLAGDALFPALAERGLVVRTFGHEPLLADVLRASIATPPENDRLVAVLAELLRRPVPSLPAPAGDPVWGRRGTASRRTRETTIDARVNLDGSGRSQVATGVGFLDHMLTALATHGLLDLELSCTGDLHVDEHHTVEDCGIVLGQALDRALGDRGGIHRFGDARAPLDEALAECTVDLGGRGVARIALGLSGQPVGGVAAPLWAHSLDSLARAGRMNLHLTSIGDDDHHVVEAAFKALARALRAAVARDPRRGEAVASTKGAL